MRIALAQYSMSPDVSVNTEKAISLIHEAAHRAVDLIAFPELCVTPFFPQHPGQDFGHFASSINDETIRKIQDSCRRLRIAAIPNLFLKEGGRLFDASPLIDRDGHIQGISKMVHIGQMPGFFEQDYYTPSDTGFRVYDTIFGVIGIVICFDRHFPESIRTCALRGASLVVVPTANIMDEPRDVFECEMRAAAYQNCVFVAMCNRVGAEGGVVFCGESIAVDPNGNITAKCGITEELLIIDINLSEAELARKVRPYLSLRRTEMYV